MTYNNNQTKELNEFQKKRIKSRTLFDFFNELDSLTEKKNKYSTVFSNQIEFLVKKFDENGILFYSIDIELPFLNIKDNIWPEVHTHVEEFINYIGGHIELVEFCYLVIEIKDRKPIWQGKVNSFDDNNIFPCIKGIIGVRSFLGKNKLLLYEIKDIFIMPFFNIKINWLDKSSSVLKYWNFIINQKNFKFHRFVNYSDFYSEIYGAIADEELKFDNRSAFGQENHFISKTMNISGIKKKNPKKKELILYFLNLFFVNNNMKIFKNIIFIKINKSKFSWEKIYSLSEMKLKFVDIFLNLQSLYPQQLTGLNFLDFVFNDLDFVFDKIKKNNSLLPMFNIFDNIIEFNNGIFFLDQKKFFFFSEILENKEYKTIFYIDCMYEDLNLSDFWFSFFSEKVNEIFVKELNSKFKEYNKIK